MAYSEPARTAARRTRLLASSSSSAVRRALGKAHGAVPDPVTVFADEIPAVPFVGIAYGFIWIAVLGYVLVLGKNLGRIKGEVEELRRKLDGAGAGGAREAQRR